MPPLDPPRVLFLTPNAFNQVTGGGVTFSNLFRGWPKDRLATATNDPFPVARDVCENYFFLGPEEIGYAFPVGLFARKERPALSDAGAGASGGWKAAARKIIGRAGVPDAGRLSRSFAEWIAAFRPEVLYTILGSLGYMDLVEAAARRFSIPVVVHFQDHGMTDPRWNGLFGNRIRRRYNQGLRRLLPRAAARLAIGAAMAAEYERAYGLPFLHFQNTLDLEKIAPHARKTAAPGKPPLSIVYIGSVLPEAQLSSLEDIARAAAALNDGGLAVRFDVYTEKKLFGRHAAALENHAAVRVHDAIADDAAFFATIGRADLLVLPVNFDPASVHFIRLSMPTKVPSYLASGTPILLYGPAGVAQVDYALKEAWGLAVTERDPRRLADGLRRALTDAPLRQQLSARAKEVASQNHDAARVRAAFQNTLREAARDRAR